MPRQPKSDVAGVVKSLRLTPAQWAELKRRGGADYLRVLLSGEANSIEQVQNMTGYLPDGFKLIVKQ